ncbi:cardiolipin synthase [Pseudophaeobacter sp.]|uniref:cardiolipin synthase n=1 Tax=Pseudophaeobacter sp. TaxID=1971739 RepID=UPI0032987EAF
MFWVAISTLAVFVMWTLAVLGALSAARTSRTPQGAIGWVVFLLAAPLTALPAYLVFGHYRFKDYHSIRQDIHEVVHDYPDLSPETHCDAACLDINPAPFEAVSGLSLCTGNDFKILVNGDDSFRAMFGAIDRAVHYVLVQFYTIRDDELGQKLRDHLIAAAQRGASVWFMYDNVGSHSLSRAYLQSLEQAAINVVEPATSRGPKHRFHINFRNHRKTLIVDGRIGFTGGLNVGNEYLGLDSRFGHWRDTQLQLTGPMVQQLQLSYAEDWQWLTDEPLMEFLEWQPEPRESNRIGLVVPTGPGDLTENGSMLFFSAISAANSRIWIASPYFVPDLDVVAALKLAALRGVDVRILLPGNFDHYLPWLAAFSFYDDLRQAGVKIYNYSAGFMHQKSFVVDDQLAAIGTANLDNRSFRLNFETMALLFDATAAKELSDILQKDFDQSSLLAKDLDQQKWSIRLLAPLVRLLSPVL